MRFGQLLLLLLILVRVLAGEPLVRVVHKVRFLFLIRSGLPFFRCGLRRLIIELEFILRLGLSLYGRLVRCLGSIMW